MGASSAIRETELPFAGRIYYTTAIVNCKVFFCEWEFFYICNKNRPRETGAVGHIMHEI